MDLVGTHRPFKIPRRERIPSEDCQYTLPVNSREAKEIEYGLKRQAWDKNDLAPSVSIMPIKKVDNRFLEREYHEKKSELREQGRTPKELTEQLAFCVETDATLVSEICRIGLECTGTDHSLGDGKMGVTVWRCPDLCVRAFNWPASGSAFLLVFKIVKGRVKSVSSKSSPDTPNMEPTPNHDCHVSRNTANSSVTNLAALLRSTQYYLYEYNDEGLPAKRPRQCLPYAVIPLKRDDLSSPCSPKRPMMPAVSPLTPGKEFTKHAEELRSPTFSDEDGILVWRGLVTSSNKSLGRVSLFGGHKLGFNFRRSYLDVSKKIPLKKLALMMPGDLRSAWKYPLLYRNHALSVCNMKVAQDQPTETFTSFTKDLTTRAKSAGVFCVDKMTTMFLVLSCKEAVRLGLCETETPARVFCIVCRRQPSPFIQKFGYRSLPDHPCDPFASSLDSQALRQSSLDMDTRHSAKIVVSSPETSPKLSDKHKSSRKMLKRSLSFSYRPSKPKDASDGGRGVCRSMSSGERFVSKEETAEMWGANTIARSDKGRAHIEDRKSAEKLPSSLDSITTVEELHCKRLSCDSNNNANLNVNGSSNNTTFFEKSSAYLKKRELGHFESEIQQSRSLQSLEVQPTCNMHDFQGFDSILCQDPHLSTSSSMSRETCVTLEQGIGQETPCFQGFPSTTVAQKELIVFPRSPSSNLEEVQRSMVTSRKSSATLTCYQGSSEESSRNLSGDNLLGTEESETEKVQDKDSSCSSPLAPFAGMAGKKARSVQNTSAYDCVVTTSLTAGKDQPDVSAQANCPSQSKSECLPLKTRELRPSLFSSGTPLSLSPESVNIVPLDSESNACISNAAHNSGGKREGRERSMLRASVNVDTEDDSRIVVGNEEEEECATVASGDMKRPRYFIFENQENDCCNKYIAPDNSSSRGEGDLNKLEESILSNQEATETTKETERVMPFSDVASCQTEPNLYVFDAVNQSTGPFSAEPSNAEMHQSITACEALASGLVSPSSYSHPKVCIDRLKLLQAALKATRDGNYFDTDGGIRSPCLVTDGTLTSSGTTKKSSVKNMSQNIDFTNIQSCIPSSAEDNEATVINCTSSPCAGGVIEISLIEDWGFATKSDDVNATSLTMKSSCVPGICRDDLDSADVGNAKRSTGERPSIEDSNFSEPEIFESAPVGLVETFTFRDNAESGDNNRDAGNREGIRTKGEREEYVDKEKGRDVISKVVLSSHINSEAITNSDDFASEVKCSTDLSEWSGLDKCESGGGVVSQCELYSDRNLHGEVSSSEVLRHKNDSLGHHSEFEGPNDKLDTTEFCYVDTKVVGAEISSTSFSREISQEEFLDDFPRTSKNVNVGDEGRSELIADHSKLSVNSCDVLERSDLCTLEGGKDTQAVVTKNYEVNEYDGTIEHGTASVSSQGTSPVNICLSSHSPAELTEAVVSQDVVCSRSVSPSRLRNSFFKFTQESADLRVVEGSWLAGGAGNVSKSQQSQKARGNEPSESQSPSLCEKSVSNSDEARADLKPASAPSSKETHSSNKIEGHSHQTKGSIADSPVISRAQHTTCSLRLSTHLDTSVQNAEKLCKPHKNEMFYKLRKQNELLKGSLTNSREKHTTSSLVHSTHLPPNDREENARKRHRNEMFVNFRNDKKLTPPPPLIPLDTAQKHDRGHEGQRPHLVRYQPKVWGLVRPSNRHRWHPYCNGSLLVNSKGRELSHFSMARYPGWSPHIPEVPRAGQYPFGRFFPGLVNCETPTSVPIQCHRGPFLSLPPPLIPRFWYFPGDSCHLPCLSNRTR